MNKHTQSAKKITPKAKPFRKSWTLNNAPLLLLGTLLVAWVGLSSYLLGHELAERNLSANKKNITPVNDKKLTPETHRQINLQLKKLTDRNQNLHLALKSNQQHLRKIAQKAAELESKQTRLEAFAKALSKDGNTAEIFDFSTRPPTGGIYQANSASFSYQELSEQLAILDIGINRTTDQLEHFSEYLKEQKTGAHFVKSPPIEKGWLSSDFGMRRDPFSGMRTMHTGLDFAAKLGSPILAVAAGTITYSGRMSGYGNTIEITHSPDLVTRYAHCKKLIGKVGDQVKASQQIATIGSTGRSTGPHLHFEVLKNNQQVNPKQFFRSQTILAALAKR